MDNLDKTISIFDIASDSNESGPKGLIQKFWSEWQPIEELGRGSYGTVFKCSRKNGSIESKSAVKIISIPQNKSETKDLSSEGMTNAEIDTYYKNIVDDFGNEIALMEQLKGHSNIVSIEDYRVEKKADGIGWDILVRMELLTPFADYVQNNNLSEDDIIKLGTDILTALEVCEKKNIVHRDIKPENIFVNDFGNFKLGDFGIAKRFESLGASHSQKGTFNYMAPEVASGTHYDSTVDIYSLGLVLYRLANNNCLPFLTPENKTSPKARKDALEKRLSGEKIPAPNCQNEALATAILKALEFNPSDRYKTAAEFKKDLLNVNFVPNYTATSNEKTFQIDDVCENEEIEKTVKFNASGEQTHKTVYSEAEKTVRMEDVSDTELTSFVAVKKAYYTRTGDYIYFGSYPQIEVTNSSLTTKLAAVAGTSNWTSNNCHVGDSSPLLINFKDATYDGNNYRGIYFTRPFYWSCENRTKSISEKSDNSYYTNKIYWYKFEPIKWKILVELNCEALLITDMLIDLHDYNQYKNNNYANSSIRNWLNDTFYNTAFNTLEQELIKITNVDNSIFSTGDSMNPYVCGDTKDKIFLLSNKDVTNRSYGFGSNLSRVKKLTSYAKIQSSFADSGADKWWLRSPNDCNIDCVRIVLNDGRVGNTHVYKTDIAVAPALHLTL